ncbi:MAG TPA: Flp family type IVb pilin [Sphingomonas bacterium]|jgi:pilus assembly protein Flp/PilA|uniref:Flp family type IVb pilin n=1 Tax=Sphingomonas bacterium TaxID=1895847 RepID=A0A3D0WFT5_9SPHN|nr:Flp family type IVb pilin [Sphingomonas bacterium]
MTWQGRSSKSGRRKDQVVKRFFRDTKAATAIEYGLIAALIAVAAIAAMQGLGNSLKATFDNVASNMKTT